MIGFMKIRFDYNEKTIEKMKETVEIKLDSIVSKKILILTREYFIGDNPKALEKLYGNNISISKILIYPRSLYESFRNYSS
jgi:hypothetical protein